MASFQNEAPRAFPLPTISEDTLHYALHLPPNDSTTTETDAAALATMISTFVQSLLTQPWLWNKDAWELKVDSAAMLSGTMRVGDAVDDEWLVVWLLREVSRRWPELVISIRDSDGEFLLIEAANELPSWVAPENAENRLWLSGGHLHLVPLTVRSSPASRPKQLSDDQYDDTGRAFDPDAWVSEADALAAVRTGKYRAEDKMENAVWERISCYPAALKTHQHHTKAYLPEPVARALRSSPELIQRAVEGFYVRDPAQLRAAARMTHFPPSPAVLSSVLMTRAAYAQLQGQVFHPPRVFGPEWHVADGKENEDERRWRDLGVKIATGFEIMYREGGRKGRVADAETNVDDFSADPAYQKYISDLKRAGFFGDELQGSAEWKKRETEAAKGWVKARSSDTTQQRQSFAYLVDNAIEKSAAVPASDLAVSKDSPEDGDSWLEVDPAEVDAMLRQRAGAAKPAAPTGELGDEQGRALQELAAKVQEFVGGQGDLEGARFADEISDDDMNSDSDDEPGPTEEEKKERMAKLVPGLPAEEWGRRTQSVPEQSDVDMDTEKKSAPKPDFGAKGMVAGTQFGDSMLPPKMRPPMFEKQKFDGVESDSSDDEDDLPAPGSFGRKIAEMKWGDGAPKREAHIEEISDDDGEGDAEEKADRARAKDLKFDDDDLDELMRQRVWGGDDNDKDEGEGDDGMDVDMDDEQEDFLKFSREALGISDEMWDNIIKSRRERGAFVPEPKAKKAESSGKTPGPKRASASEVKMDTDPAPAPGKPNEALNSFESMMTAMEAELDRAREEQGHGGPAPPPAPKVQFKRPAAKPESASGDKTQSKSKGKAKGKGKSKFTSLATLPSEADLDNMDDDELAAMDAELRAALEDAGDIDDDGDIPEVGQLSEDQQREYRMMRNLLESASGGDGGAASALLARLGQGMGK